MKVYTGVVTLMALAVPETTTSFTVTHGTSSNTRSLALSASADSSMDRRAFFNSIVVGSTASASLLVVPNVAHAAKYGSFGSEYPEVLDPRTAVVDQDILKSDAVQRALGNIRVYSETVVKLTAALEADSQVDIGPILRRDFEFSQLRTSLNAINSALDEDSQRGTDRLIRIILQDLTELEQSNKQKPGVARSARRVENMRAKLAKLQQAFNDYLAFA